MPDYLQGVTYVSHPTTSGTFRSSSWGFHRTKCWHGETRCGSSIDQVWHTHFPSHNRDFLDAYPPWSIYHKWKRSIHATLIYWKMNCKLKCVLVLLRCRWCDERSAQAKRHNEIVLTCTSLQSLPCGCLKSLSESCSCFITRA